MTRRRARWALALAVVSASCSKLEGDRAPLGSGATRADAGPPRPAPAKEEVPQPRKGMVWVPGGALVAGTAPEKTPRVADEEMRGEQVILHGFFVDEYPFPNEAGAIPKTGTTQAEASALCRDQGKRLCTELEWERACKGPANTTYEYGDVYRPTECATGAAARLSPSGLRVGCKSAFGVHDLHGGSWEWTASAWGRGAPSNLVTVRGGNAEAGELVGRCANAMGRAPTVKKPDIGLRCCAGEPNDVEVTLHVVRGRPLEPREVDPRLAAAIVGSLAPGTLPAGAEAFKIDRMWSFRPIGNEELLLAGGCAKRGEHAACGVAVSRMRFETPVLLGYASAGWWASTLHEDHDTRDLWVFGGDEHGSFRRRIAYVWGRISIGEAERKGKRDAPP